MPIYTIHGWYGFVHTSSSPPLRANEVACKRVHPDKEALKPTISGTDCMKLQLFQPMESWASKNSK